jgi:prepilin-type N-terminal cleavage/methylation domain-containing protein
MGRALFRLDDFDVKPLRSFLLRFENQRGVTLVELVFVMLIMLIAIAGLSQGFSSVSRAEVDQANRASDEQSARQALERMREDIHCASAVQPAQPAVDALGNPTGGWIITLTETPATSTQGCPGVTSTASAVQWCTFPVGGGTIRYQLYRSTTYCDKADATFQVDYVTQANIWPATTCTVGRYPTVGFDMPVNRNPLTHSGRTYELKDEIAMRNATPPTTC